MDLEKRLTLERRTRLAAEQLLDLRTRELARAEERLARHNRSVIRRDRPQPFSGADRPPDNSSGDGTSPQAHAGALIPNGQDRSAAVFTQNQDLDQEAGTTLPEQSASRENQPPAPLPAPPFFRSSRGVAQIAGRTAPAPRGFWAVADILQDGLALFHHGHGLTGANRAFRAAFGIGETSGGQTLPEILHAAVAAGLIRTGDQSPADWLTDTLGRLGSIPVADVLIQIAAGGWKRLSMTCSETGDLICQLVDITYQMRIWAALEAIPDGFVLFDREDRMVICNQSYRDIYQTSAPVMTPGISFEEILRYGLARGEYPEALGREEDWITARMEEHRTPAAEGEHQLKDGRWLRSIDKETPDGGRVGLRVDITQLREQATALEAARLAAEAASRAKSAFLANMSHEIRTPMNGVVGMAELLCDTPLSAEQRLFADTIRSSGEALLVIINDILDYSKIEAERLTLHPCDFDLERTIHEVVMLLQPRAREKGIELMIDFDVFLPTRFTGDPGRLRQILTNLIGNAVKFTENGHVLTRVVGLELAGGAHQLHITVEDTGIGIAASLLDHVFGEFYQVDDEQNRRFEGTGLGLAITRRLVERMGGAVWVDSEYGKGSVFGFRLALPLAENAGPVQLPAPLSSVMVVDDQFINRTILERQLAPCAIPVTLCRSGEEALRRIAEGGAPDVILTDHEMPGMGGVTLARNLREAGYDRPIVLLSSHTLAASEAEAVPYDAILQKPVLRAELYRQLTRLTGPARVEATAPPPEETPMPGLRAMRVLAAEDNRTNQLVLQKMVRQLDIELRFAADGREALTQWRDFRPDLIFMDISMPDMDGKQATRAIRSEEAAQQLTPVPIIALTAHMMEGDAAGFLATGMDLCLAKPLRRSEISAAIARFQPGECRQADPAASGLQGAASPLRAV